MLACWTIPVAHAPKIATTRPLADAGMMEYLEAILAIPHRTISFYCIDAYCTVVDVGFNVFIDAKSQIWIPGEPNSITYLGL